MAEYLARTDSFIASLGLEAYRVGGSVRDEILGRRVKDADYMIRGASLAEIAARLDATHAGRSPLKLRDGRQAGWRALAGGLGLVEIVLPRKEVSTGPGHRDFEIVVDPFLPLAEDAKRRDFTFNALYKMIHKGTGRYEDPMVDVLDKTGRGLHDLQRRLINVTHADSFRDDPLRILRALRFVSTLDYELGPETRATMMLHADAVNGLTDKGVSGTVLGEFSKLLMGQCPAKALRLARDTGVLAHVLPELAPMLGFDQGSRYHDMTTDEHVFTALETAAHVDAPLRVRWALLFHDSGKPDSSWIGKDGRKHYYAPSPKVWAEVANIGQEPIPEDHEVVGARIWRHVAARLNAPKAMRDAVNRLILDHMVPTSKVDRVRVRRERVRLGDELLRDLYLMRMCDLSGKGNKNGKMLANVGALEQVRCEAEEAGIPASIKDLKINGNDVKNIATDGRDVGRILAAVLDEVVCDPNGPKLTREWQLKAAMRHA